MSYSEYADMDVYELAQAIEGGRQREARAANMLTWAAVTIANPKQKHIKLTDVHPIQRGKKKRKRITKADRARAEERFRRRDEAKKA